MRGPEGGGVAGATAGVFTVCTVCICVTCRTLCAFRIGVAMRYVICYGAAVIDDDDDAVASVCAWALLCGMLTFFSKVINLNGRLSAWPPSS